MNIADDEQKIILIFGGVSSGKSLYAEKMFADIKNTKSTAKCFYFTPAGIPQDDEMKDKVAAHRARRPEWMMTVECGTEPEAEFEDLPKGSIVLFDSIGTLLGRMMMSGCRNCDDAEKVLRAMCRTARSKHIQIIFVSEEVGMTLVPVTDSGRAFQKAMGRINQIIAALADEVYFVAAGLPQRLK